MTKDALKGFAFQSFYTESVYVQEQISKIP